MAKEKEMRLTVFNVKDINLSEYQKSYDRLIEEMGTSIPLDDAKQNTFVAVFNGSILGVCSANENTINYFYVLEVTRHRGVGTYLFTQSVSSLLKTYKTVRISEKLYQSNQILKDFINIFDPVNFEIFELNFKGFESNMNKNQH